MSRQLRFIKYFTAYLFIGLALGSYYPILSSYLKNDLNFSGNEVGTITAFTLIVSIFTLPLWGFLTDKIKSPKKTLIVSLIFSSIMMFTVTTVTSYHGFLILISLFMIFRAPVFGLYDEILIDVCKRDQFNYGSLRVGGSVGFAIALFIGGIFAEHYGTVVHFMLSAIFFFMVATLILLSEDVKYHHTESLNIKVDVPILLKNRFYLFVVIIHAITFGVMDSNMMYMSTYIKGFTNSNQYVSLAVFLSTIIEFPILYSTRFIYKKLSLKHIFYIVNLLNIIRYTLLFFYPNITMILILAPIHGITFGLTYPMVIQFIRENVRVNVMATAYAIYNVVLSLATALFSYLSGSVIGIFETKMNQLFILYIAIYFANTFLILILLKKYHYQATIV